MLHTICFLRLLGTLEPTTHEVLGVELVRLPLLTQPYVDDAATERRLREAVDKILARLDAEVHQGTAVVDVVVAWHKAESTSPVASPRTEQPPAHPVFHSPYSWLASALSVRADGRVRDGKPAHKALTEDKAAGLGATFEQWVVSMHIAYGGSDTPDLRTFLRTSLFSHSRRALLCE